MREGWREGWWEGGREGGREGGGDGICFESCVSFGKITKRFEAYLSNDRFQKVIMRPRFGKA